MRLVDLVDVFREAFILGKATLEAGLIDLIVGLAHERLLVLLDSSDLLRHEVLDALALIHAAEKRLALRPLAGCLRLGGNPTLAVASTPLLSESDLRGLGAVESIANPTSSPALSWSRLLGNGVGGLIFPLALARRISLFAFVTFVVAFFLFYPVCAVVFDVIGTGLFLILQILVCHLLLLWVTPIAREGD
jgi:hypothetical protein